MAVWPIIFLSITFLACSWEGPVAQYGHVWFRPESTHCAAHHRIVAARARRHSSSSSAFFLEHLRNEPTLLNSPAEYKVDFKALPAGRFPRFFSPKVLTSWPLPWKKFQRPWRPGARANGSQRYQVAPRVQRLPHETLVWSWHLHIFLAAMEHLKKGRCDASSALRNCSSNFRKKYNISRKISIGHKSSLLGNKIELLQHRVSSSGG